MDVLPLYISGTQGWFELICYQTQQFEEQTDKRDVLFTTAVRPA